MNHSDTTFLAPETATGAAGADAGQARAAAPADPALAPLVTLVRGDGIGPEIMQATLAVLEAAGARLRFEEIEVGERVYRAGHAAGIAPESWAAIRRSRVLLKAPITTPQGGGYKSLNVTLRKTLGLYANVRPCTAFAPFVPTRHPALDLVVVRENEEDLYAGIEHRQTEEVVQCLKLISRPGCERIARYAFEYARRNGRRRVTCMTKDNIMKLTDGLFRQVFEEVGAHYPEIEREHMIVDIGAARLADTPERFDVVLCPNLYGDILSDIAAQVAGSVGLAGSANVGAGAAMFEAVHGSAPDIAGRDLANPSGLLHAACMMLVHLGQPEVAVRIGNAIRATLEDGVHTADLQGAHTVQRVGTQGFAAAVIERLGRLPAKLPPVAMPQGFAAEAGAQPGTVAEASAASVPDDAAAPDGAVASEPAACPVDKRPVDKRLVGVDVFVAARTEPASLAASLRQLGGDGLELRMITNRGVKVWPDGAPETLCTDHWRCRFTADQGASSHAAVVALLGRCDEAGLDFVKTEHLYTFDGVPGFSLGQGQ